MLRIPKHLALPVCAARIQLTLNFMTSPHLLFYVSGHGFGHARRTAAVIEHLLRSRPHVKISVRTKAPPRIFTAVGVSAEQVSPTSLDGGVVEHDALNVDVPATIGRVRELLGR